MILISFCILFKIGDVKFSQFTFSVEFLNSYGSNKCLGHRWNAVVKGTKIQPRERELSFMPYQWTLESHLRQEKGLSHQI